MAVKRGYETLRLKAHNTDIVVYTSPNIVKALKDIVAKASLYEGVRLTQIMEAVYLQGKKDGARAAFEAVDRQYAAVKRQIPHKRPGRPKKS